MSSRNWKPHGKLGAPASAPASEHHTTPPDDLDFMIRFESGDLTEDELVAGFQRLINSGLAWQLQGVYGRTAHALIVAGKCHPRTGGAL
jgi:hypothetical protein